MSAEREVGIALLGAGSAGWAHARQYAALRTDLAGATVVPRVVSVSDADPARARELAEVLGARVVDVPDALAGTDVDAVDICLPDAWHVTTARGALAAGKDLLCEKPLGGGSADALALVREATTSGRVAMMGFQYRYLPCVRQAVDLVGAGVVGSPRALRLSFQRDLRMSPEFGSGWRAAAGNDLGVLGAMGSHAIDLVHCLVAATESVAATSWAVDGGRTTVDSSSLLLRLAGGAVASLHVSWADIGHKHRLQCEVTGSSGSVIFDTRVPDVVRVAGSARSEDGFATVYVPDESTGATLHGMAVGFDRALRSQLTAFVNAVATSEPTSPSVADGLRVDGVLRAARRAADTGTWVRVDDEC